MHKQVYNIMLYASLLKHKSLRFRGKIHNDKDRHVFKHQVFICGVYSPWCSVNLKPALVQTHKQQHIVHNAEYWINTEYYHWASVLLSLPHSYMDVPLHHYMFIAVFWSLLFNMGCSFASSASSMSQDSLVQALHGHLNTIYHVKQALQGAC